IEAAWLAAGIAPGSRRAFGFERWLDHDASAFARLRAESEAATSARRARKRPTILGSDLDPERVAEARANAEHAGVGDWLRFEVADARALELRRGWNACVVTNAPYGVRVGDAGERGELVALYRDFGARLRACGQGSTLALLALDPEHVRALGLRGLRRVELV